MEGKIVLRPYQQEAVERAIESLQKHGSTLLVMATGLGKTIVFAEVIRRYLSLGRVLVLTHREELVYQAVNKLGHLDPVIEMNVHRGGSGLFPGRLIVGTVQTVYRRNLPWREIVLLVIDECHHAAAKTWKTVMRQVPQAHVLGVTATPERHDGGKLPFDSICYTYGLLDAIRDGWLVPVDCYCVKDIQVDLANVGVDGDFDVGDLSRVISEEKVLHAICDLSHRLEGRTLVFVPSIEDVKRFVEVYGRYFESGCGGVWSGQAHREREYTIEKFRSGELRVLVNCGIATEGFDVPEIQNIVLARPTRSALLLMQMIGRGTRPLPSLVDRYADAPPEVRRAVIGNSSKPRLNVYLLHAINAKKKPAGVLDICGGRILCEVGDVTESEVWEAAGDKIRLDELEVEKFLAEAKRRKAERARRSFVAQAIEYQLSPVGIFSLLKIDPPVLDSGEVGGVYTEKLKLLGVPTKNMTEAMAKAVLEKLYERKWKRLATYRQIKLLRHRIPDEVLMQLTVEEAGRLITALQAGNYQYFAGIWVPRTLQDLVRWRVSYGAKRDHRGNKRTRAWR